MAILVSDKIDIQSKLLRDKGHLTIKGWEDIIIVTIYAPNFGTPKYLNKY